MEFFEKRNADFEDDDSESVDNFYDEDDKLGGDLDGGSRPDPTNGDGRSRINIQERIENLKEALKKPKNAIIAVGIAIFAVFAIGGTIFGGKKKNIYDASKSMSEPEIATMPDEIQNAAARDAVAPTPPKIQPPIVTVPELPPLPEVPQLEMPDPDHKKLDNFDLAAFDEKPAPEEPEEIAVDDFKLEEKKKRKVRNEEQAPPIFDLSGQGPAQTKKTNPSSKEISDFIFIDSAMDAEAEDEATEAKKIKDLDNIIAQGRIIDAVLETAINSEIPGSVRAIVTRNVYGEIGKNILIPRGARLYGSYQSATSNSQQRIIVTWSRMIRPDGISAALNGFAADQFGRSGIEGNVDHKYSESMASAMLLSMIPLAATIATTSITGSTQQITTNSMTGTNTVVQDPVNIATQAFVNQVGNATKGIVQNMLDTKTLIRVNQGTRLRVLVNQDLKLPAYKAVTKSVSEIK